MKRVLCLYRVSTLKQVDKKDDIPMQRRECMDFIGRMEDWSFYEKQGDALFRFRNRGTLFFVS